MNQKIIVLKIFFFNYLIFSKKDDNDSLSDIENNIEQELPAKEKTTYFKSQDIKHNFSFEEKKKKEELPNSKLKYQDNTFKSYEKSKIEDLKLKYSHKKAKPSQEYENKHIQKEKRLDLVSMGPRIFIEIKQINSEIDVLEKDLEKNFKFYNKQLN